MGTKAKPLSAAGAGGVASFGHSAIWVPKKTSARNNPSALSLTVTRRVSPPAPHPQSPGVGPRPFQRLGFILFRAAHRGRDDPWPQLIQPTAILWPQDLHNSG